MFAKQTVKIAAKIPEKLIFIKAFKFLHITTPSLLFYFIFKIKSKARVYDINLPSENNLLLRTRREFVFRPCFWNGRISATEFRYTALFQNAVGINKRGLREIIFKSCIHIFMI